MRWECRKLLVSDPGKHHGTCVTHVPWCMSGSLTQGWRGKRFRHSRRMHNVQFYVSGRRPVEYAWYKVREFINKLPAALRLIYQCMVYLYVVTSRGFVWVKLFPCLYKTLSLFACDSLCVGSVICLFTLIIYINLPLCDCHHFHGDHRVKGVNHNSNLYSFLIPMKDNKW